MTTTTHGARSVLTAGLAGRPCPDCGAKPGEQHNDWCGVERCPDCGGQLISNAAKEREMTIEEMKAELKIIDQQAKELADKRTTLRQQIVDAQALFTVGARVTHEGATCVWEITDVRPGYSFSDEPQYIGAKIKKDGTPGTLQSRIYVPWGKQLLAA